MRTPLLPLLLALPLFSCGESVPGDRIVAAQQAFDSGEYEEAEEHYRAALADFPEEDPAYHALKVEHLQALCYVSGDDTLAEIQDLKDDPSPKEYRTLALELFKAGAMEQTASVMKLAIIF